MPKLKNYLKMNRSQLLLFSLIIILLLSLSACSNLAFPGGKNPRTDDFYKGTEGVRMWLPDPSSPPSKMYFYGADSIEENSFNIFINLWNVGASWTQGAVFVSGYDPHMITLYGVDDELVKLNWNGCDIGFGGQPDLDTGNIGNLFGMFFSVNCPDQGVGAFYNNPDQWGAQLNSLAQLFGWNPDSWINSLGFSYMQQPNGQGYFYLDVGDSYSQDNLDHGKGMLILMSGMQLGQFGTEYTLAPDAYEYPGGEKTSVSFEGYIHQWPMGLDRTEKAMPFLITNCYAYSTYAAPQVCIDPRPQDLEANKVCIPQRITYNGGNGAPVAVTSIEQENTLHKVYFDINIRNVGKGQVFDLGQLAYCSPYFPGRLTLNQLNKVYLLDARIGQQHLYCTPDRGRGIRLDEHGQGSVRCTYDMQLSPGTMASSAYETPLIIEIGYGYQETTQTNMMIKRVT